MNGLVCTLSLGDNYFIASVPSPKSLWFRRGPKGCVENGPAARAGAEPLPRFGIFPVFPKPGKSERASALLAIHLRNLGLVRL